MKTDAKLFIGKIKVGEQLLEVFEHSEEELEETETEYVSDWDRNIGECPKWFYGICEHSEYGETICNHCKRNWNEK